MATEIRVPTLGESVTEATIGTWLKKAGDTVAVDEPLVELETDKVTLEVPAPAAGVLSEILAKEGETVEVNALLGQIEAGDGAASGKSGRCRRARLPVGEEEGGGSPCRLLWQARRRSCSRSRGIRHPGHGRRDIQEGRRRRAAPTNPCSNWRPTRPPRRYPRR